MPAACAECGPQAQLSEVQAEAMHTHKLLKQAHKIEDVLSQRVTELQVRPGASAPRPALRPPP